MSKRNYGSSKGHSIEIETLKKVIVFYHAKKTEEVNVCTMSDLEACYDRKISELCRLVE